MPVLQLPPSTTPLPANTRAALRAITTQLASSKRAMVLVGAGISTNAGIADFRGTHGIYTSTSTSESKAKGPSNQSLFSAQILSHPLTAGAHFQMVARLQTDVHAISKTRGRKAATATHAFLSTLKRKGVLARVYSQNIDGLELHAGLTRVRMDEEGNGKGKGKGKWEGDVVQLHGSIHDVRCSLCGYLTPCTPAHTALFASGSTMDCPDCLEMTLLRSLAGKRSTPNRSYLRPAIVLYDESSPYADEIGELASEDLKKGPDFLLVFGSSLRIPGFKNLIKSFAAKIRERPSKGTRIVLVNKEKLGAEWDKVFDVQIVGCCAQFSTLVEQGWKKGRPQDWQIQTTLQNLVVKKDRAGELLAAAVGQS